MCSFVGAEVLPARRNQGLYFRQLQRQGKKPPHSLMPSTHQLQHSATILETRLRSDEIISRRSVVSQTGLEQTGEPARIALPKRFGKAICNHRYSAQAPSLSSLGNKKLGRN